MVEELLKKIPPEKRWAITSEALTRFSLARGSKIMPFVLGEEEGVIAPVWGFEKMIEIFTKVHGDSMKKMYLWVKEKFNMQVEDAVGGAKLSKVAGVLMFGPDMKSEIVEKSKKKVLKRYLKCAWDERFNELEMKPELLGACHIHEPVNDEAIKAINPKLIYKVTKSLASGDPYCEVIIEYKED
jgi:hypothetical protein